ncbi:MAG TPA: GNAT family N-acetyltransferase, partial [Candidatus Bathyarchaeia archaeon]|nr:GNAT family N-acetyltransferase [Candidatus Bathyarchaeia archaeon]
MSEQRTLSIVPRAFDPSDYERMVEIGNANFPDYPVSVAEQRSRDEAVEKSKIFHSRLTFTDSNTGTIVGFGTASQVIDMLHPTKFMINIIVQPELQGRGIGTTVYDTILQQMEQMG